MTTFSFSNAFVRVPVATHETIQDIDWAKLTHLIRQPQFLEALYIASPALYDEAIKLDTSRLPDEKSKRIVYSLMKYLSRYGTRCTPFGLFGGFSLLPITNAATRVRIDPSVQLRKVTRLDMNYLCALAQDLENHPTVKPYLRFSPNTSLYRVNKQYRYVSYRYNEAGMRMHHLSSADQTDYLDGVLTLAQSGATIQQLVNQLIADDVSAEDAEAYIDQVLDAQLLVSELEPALTGDDFLVQILHQLQRIQEQHPTTELAQLLMQLTTLKASLKQIDETASDHSVEKFAAIEQQLRQLPTPFDRKVLFQIDTYLPETEGQLNKGLINKLIAKLPTLLKLTPGGNSTLDQFCQQFTEKYEEEEVPFVIALDPELGLGYPAGQNKTDVSPLIDGISSDTKAENERFVIPAEHRYLLQKIAEAQLTGTYQIDIREDDLRSVDARQTRLPLTNTAMFSVIREQGREKIVMDFWGNYTGTSMLGRFGHTDPSVLTLLQEISQAEDVARPGVIFADIVHLPEARTGNIIIRPQLKAYQIPFLGKASVDKEHEIPVTDLMISVRGNTVRLRSKSLNRPVIPRLANAHNFSHADSLDSYHFLCAIQAQNERGSLTSVTGSISNLFLFMPRIALDTIILSAAQWNFQQTHVTPLVKAFKQESWPALREEISRWRAQYRIPRYVSLVDLDNELYVDLENQWLTETFVNEIKSKDKFTIKEFLHSADSAVVQSPAGWHTNQFVVTFQNTTDVPKLAPMPSKPIKTEAAPVARKFFAGSDWLYYKVYTGIKLADALLADVMFPLTERFRANGWIDKFFFIRYADPAEHIRFRFHFIDPKFTGDVIRELHDALAPYVANKTITAVVNDTYNRELERYGSNSINAVEECFHIDSHVILQFLSQIEGAEGEECRWRFGMKLMHDLLNLFGLDWKQRIDLTEQQVQYFGKEFGYNPAQKKQLDGRFREIENAIQELFDENNAEEHGFFYDLCHQRSEQLLLMVQYVQSLHEQHELQTTPDDLIGSLIHMTINRLFRSRQRFVEYSLYYHLHKYYRAAFGRAAFGRVVYGRTVLSNKLVTKALPA